MFHPSSPLSLALSVSFTLKYVTIPSSANRFTITMASSANSLCINIASLLCLGLKASARGTDPHRQLFHRVRSITFSPPTYLLYLNGFYVKDIGFSNPRYLPPRSGLIKGSLAFRLRFWLTLSSDPSLGNVIMQSPLQG